MDRKYMATDEELALESAGGVTDAFRQLYERHRQGVYNMARRFLGNREAAEDVAHECFLSAYENIGQFEPRRGSFKSWLFAIAYHKCCRFNHQKHRWLPIDLFREQIERLPAAPGLERKLDMERLIMSLPVSSKIPILLTKLHGFSVEECAEITGLTETNVKQRIFRGFKTMQRQIKG